MFLYREGNWFCCIKVDIYDFFYQLYKQNHFQGNNNYLCFRKYYYIPDEIDCFAYLDQRHMYQNNLFYYSHSFCFSHYLYHIRKVRKLQKSKSKVRELIVSFFLPLYVNRTTLLYQH